MSNRANADTREWVANRASNLGEYCLIAEEDSYHHHQIEHIISLKHGSTSDLDNLALSCIFCNLYKGSDVATIAPITGELVRFYNPRTDIWSEHFHIEDVIIRSLTDIGAATVRILQLNHPDRILEREALRRIGRYPNESALEVIRAY